MNRRELLALVSASGIAPFMRAAGSMQSSCLRGRRIRWLVGWTPGGGYDAYARLVEPLLERALGAEVVIDNQPGAAGRLAAVALSRARPDGRTIGILDGPGLLWGVASGDRGSPDLENDFSLLARIARPPSVLLASARSGIRSVGDLVAAAARRRLVFGSTAPGSQNFVNASVMGAVFGIERNFVVGYPGSREVLMGLVRGDFDLTSLTADTAIDQIKSGDAIPLVTVVPYATGSPGFDGVPSLEGPQGLIHLKPELFADPGRAALLVNALSGYLGAGRLIAAPAKLPDESRLCLEDALRSVLGGRELQLSARRAGRALSPAFGDELRRDVREARRHIGSIVPVVDEARRRVR
jgi:tripartite-type tricarboxylate transporter receptor subunit TctC